MKLTGPMLSLEAHGTLGGAITAGLWRGRPFVKRKPDSAVRWTAEQRSQRARIGYLKKMWQFLPLMSGGDAHAQWDAVTDHVSSTPYHTWLAYNMQRWTDTAAAVEYPGAIGSGTSTPSILQPVSGKGYIAFNLANLDGANEMGAMTYLRLGATPTGTLPFLVWVQHNEVIFGKRYRVYLTHLPPGSYTMRSRIWKLDGTNSSLSAPNTLIVS